jgi:hypothetical protein
MSSQSVSQVACSWVDVGSFFKAIMGQVYDIYSIGLEYFGYTLVHYLKTMKIYAVVIFNINFLYKT